MLGIGVKGSRIYIGMGKASKLTPMHCALLPDVHQLMLLHVIALGPQGYRYPCYYVALSPHLQRYVHIQGGPAWLLKRPFCTFL